MIEAQCDKRDGWEKAILPGDKAEMGGSTRGGAQTKEVIGGANGEGTQRRSHLSYKEMYCKVIGKLWTKLAVKEALLHLSRLAATLQSSLLTQQHQY